jgi:23S rRNA (cytosine1962-C5)-methyltransferase
MKKAFIKKNCDKRIRKGYLWVFSNEVENIKDFEKGEIVSLYNSKNTFCGIGYINPNSLIAIRILDFKEEVVNSDFFIKKFNDALMLRKGIFKNLYYRLIYSEADFLPGLIIDRYDNTFVVQTNTYGIDLLKSHIEMALKKLFNPINIVFKNNSEMRHAEGLEPIVESTNKYFDGVLNIIENGIKLKINVLEGQKTGYFYDQRINHKYLFYLSSNKYVADIFCYLGSFGLNALKGGAAKVDFVDSSAHALEMVKENVLLNKFDLDKCCFFNQTALTYLKELSENKTKPDVLIVDPPAFVKTKKVLNEGIKGYINLNKWAFLAAKSGSLLFTFSCSNHVSNEIFKGIIDSAASSAKKDFTIIAELSQSLDHPIHPQMVETKYLKGYILYIK